MASVKILFRPTVPALNQGHVCYKITQDHKTSTIKTTHLIYTDEWDERNSNIRFVTADERKDEVTAIKSYIRTDIERINKIIHGYEHKGIGYTCHDIASDYLQYRYDFSITGFMKKSICYLKESGRLRTSETYASALRSFMKFMKQKDTQFEYLSDEMIERYESYLSNIGLVPNSISFYMRILRAAYNRAVELGSMSQNNPFKHVYTGIEKTVKRALPLAVIKRIKDLDLRGKPIEAYARDMFMLSFYLRGMSFVDMAYLRKSDLTNGTITYRRKKTGKLLCVQWTKEMQEIVDRYPCNPSKYLLPILTNDSDSRSAYRNMNYNINRNLKKIAAMLNIHMPLTLYCARHSWASIAHSKGIPVSIISQGMGHASETVTQIYLASLDTSTVDRANRMIIQALGK